MAKALNRTRPYGTVSGDDPEINWRYEQDGHRFDAVGELVSDEGGSTTEEDGSDGEDEDVGAGDVAQEAAGGDTGNGLMQELAGAQSPTAETKRRPGRRRKEA